MANLKISQLTPGNPAQSGDLLPIDRAGANFSVSAASIAALAAAGGVTSFSGDGVVITNSASTGAVTATIAGTSGGVPYFSSTTGWGTSALLASGGLVLGGGAGTAPSTNTQLTFSAPTLTVGLAGTSSGILALTGSASGNATLTAPATAGTRTNPVISSNYFQIGVAGTTSGQLLLAGSASGTATLTAPATAGTATNAVLLSNSLQLPSGTVISFNGDTGISRDSAGVLDVGTGAAGSTVGVIQAAIVTIASIKNSATGTIIYNSGVSPSISSGFGSGASVPNNNGSASFTVNVGTGGVASTGVITMPAAAHGWSCVVTPNGAPQAAAVTYSAPTSTTSITLTNYTLTTGIALAWTASLVFQVSCWGY